MLIIKAKSIRIIFRLWLYFTKTKFLIIKIFDDSKVKNVFLIKVSWNSPEEFTPLEI